MPECEEAYTNREEKEETEMKVLKKITDFVSRYMEIGRASCRERV